MAINYPTSLDDGTSLPSRASGDTIPSSDSNDKASALIALETKLGTGASVPTTPGHVLTVTGAGATAFQAVAGTGDALTTNPLSQFASTTSAQLRGVLSDETGTGAAVFATSPTLTTPALGTPSALVATNATGTASGLTAGSANALKSATTTVDVSAAAAPTSGQVLTATGGSAATWQTPASGGGAKPRIKLFIDGRSLTDHNVTSGGTGSGYTASVYGGQLSKGTTNGGYVMAQNLAYPYQYPVFDKNPAFSTMFNFNQLGSSGTDVTAYALLGRTGTSAGSPPDTGYKWMGFKYVFSGTTLSIYGTCCDATHGEVLTSALNLTGIDPTNPTQYVAVMTSGTGVKFYINGAELGSITSNYPTGNLTNGSTYSLEIRSTTTTLNIAMQGIDNVQSDFDAY